MAYIALLVLISLSMLKEYYNYRKMRQNEQKGEMMGTRERRSALTGPIYRIGLLPKISLPRDKLSLFDMSCHSPSFEENPFGPDHLPHVIDYNNGYY